MDASQISFSATAVWVGFWAIVGALVSVVGGLVVSTIKVTRFVTTVQRDREQYQAENRVNYERIQAEVRAHLQAAESATSRALENMSGTLNLMMARINEQHDEIRRLLDRSDDHRERLHNLRRDVDVLDERVRHYGTGQ